jgi:DNA polymerase III epsilon subunit-like protein
MKENIFAEDLIVFDIETSSTNENASILQLGAFRFSRKGWITDDFFVEIVKPYTDDWSSEAERIHNLSKVYCSTYGEDLNIVLDKFDYWAQADRSILAHWGSYFDINLLKRAYEIANRKYNFSYRSYDIASIVRFEIATNNLKHEKSLFDCAKLLNVDTTNLVAHNALCDAKITALLLQKVIENVKKNNKFK